MAIKYREPRRKAALLIIFFVAVMGNAQTIFWRSTTATDPWVDRGIVPISVWDNDYTLYIELHEDKKFQQIDGWGGAINEFGWIAMAVLSQAEREKVLRALFDTSGCAFNIGRICIGANDFSLTFYSCAETPDDYSMSRFSLDKDRVNVIPFALAAKAINPSLMFWGAPHSPPAWMKQNNSMLDGSLKNDDATRKAYALYFQKWVQGMAAEQIPIYAVHIQNEPNIQGTGYPTCVMSGEEMAALIKNYIGPQFRHAGLSTEIWVGTMHSASKDFQSFYPEYIPPTLGDPATSAFVSGVGMQWSALWDAGKVTANYPWVKTMQTEVECGNFHWMPGYNADVAPNDWPYGVFVMNRMMQWLRAGVNAYCQWNMVLDETGKSNSTVARWPQNSMISINQSTGAVRYNPQFYAAKHFSHFVKPGAVRIATEGNYSTSGSNLLSENLGERVTDGDMMAFLNPDGTKVLVVRNSTDSEKTVAVKVGAIKFKPAVAPNSFNTFVITNSIAVRQGGQGVMDRKACIRAAQLTYGGMRLTIDVPTNAASRQVSLSIVDMSGRVVKEFRETAPAGRVSIEWTGKTKKGENAAQGVYFARVTFENKPMIVVSRLLRGN